MASPWSERLLRQQLQHLQQHLRLDSPMRAAANDHPRVLDLVRGEPEVVLEVLLDVHGAQVPVTVHRWIREVRRRGYLPPGRKGKTG